LSDRNVLFLDVPDDIPWPPPLLYRIEDINAAERNRVGHFIGLYESLLHFHFTAVASQFLWLFGRDDEGTADATALLGLKVIYMSLRSGIPTGGRVWLNWSAALSVAGRALCVAGREARLPELFDVLSPQDIELVQAHDPAKHRETVVRKGSPVCRVMELWQSFRNKEQGHTDLHAQDAIGDLAGGLATFAELLLAIFRPYSRLSLAYVQKAEDVYCIYGVWNARGIFQSWSNAANKRGLERIWGAPTADGLLAAPTPPDWPCSWDGSLLLYDRKPPCERYLYLMPFGYRFEKRPTGQETLPGLTDTVWWYKSDGRTDDVKSIHQKAYKDIAEFTQQASEPASDAHLHGHRTAPANIRTIVRGLRERYGIDLPGPVSARERTRNSFDLGHEQAAIELAERSVPRDHEVDRIIALAREAPDRRLLLIGPSGVGKSVVLAQIYRRLEDRAIYFSMDHAPAEEYEPEEPGSGGRISGPDGSGPKAAAPGLDECRPGKTLAVPARMHLFSRLIVVAGRRHPEPAFAQSEGEVRRTVTALLKELAEAGDAPVWVLIDALNQHGAPRALLSGLPSPLPPNLRVIATTQDIAGTIAAATDYGRNPWRMEDLRTIGRDSTEVLLLFPWPREERRNLHLPEPVLDDLHRLSGGLPLLLTAWGEELRDRWRAEGSAGLTGFHRQLVDGAGDLLPKRYRDRLGQARDGFDPASLPDLLFWSLALLERPLDLEALQRAAALLRPTFERLRPVSREDIRLALERLGGFLATGSGGRSAGQHWRLAHPLLGKWILDEQGTPERMAQRSDALLPLGAAPYLDSPDALARWTERAVDGEPVFDELPAQQQLALLDRLIAWLDAPERSWHAERLGHRVAGLRANRTYALHQAGESAEAWSEAGAARALAEHLLKTTPTDRRWKVERDLALAWSVIGILEGDREAYESALTAFERAAEIRTAVIATAPEDSRPRLRASLGAAYRNLGITLGSLGRHEEAIGEFARAIVLYEELDLAKPEFRNALTSAHHGRAFALAALDLRAEALGDYARAIELGEGLDLAQPEFRNNLAGTHVNRAIALANFGRHEEAIGDYDRAIALYEALDLDKPEFRNNLARAHENRAIALANFGRHEEAIGDCDRAIALYEALDLDKPEFRNNLARAHENRAIALAMLARYQEAVEDGARPATPRRADGEAWVGRSPRQMAGGTGGDAPIPAEPSCCALPSLGSRRPEGFARALRRCVTRRAVGALGPGAADAGRLGVLDRRAGTDVSGHACIAAGGHGRYRPTRVTGERGPSPARARSALLRGLAAL